MSIHIRHGIRCGAIALVLLGSIGIAVAQVKYPTGSPGANDNKPVTPMQQQQTTNAPSGSFAQGEMGAPPRAQRSARLSAAQKATIAQAVMAEHETITPPSGNVRLARGAQVPDSVELYALPENAVARAPQAQSYKYTVVRNDIVLVDPSTMRVVDIIRR